jgi:putative hydrolase of the HAD superfamily
MDIRINRDTFFVFDLDDTLYQEIDFLRSAYRHISNELQPAIKESIYDIMLERYKRKENVFGWIVDQYKEHLGNKDLSWLMRTYREHLPELALSAETSAFIREVRGMNIRSGLITDGRSITQRNKLKALGILELFNDIVISEEFGSEKPDERNYLYFVNKYPGSRFYYFGDNTTKDFITPAKLGWTTVCVKDKGENIHKQQFNDSGVPQFVVNGFKELTLIGERSS